MPPRPRHAAPPSACHPALACPPVDATHRPRAPIILDDPKWVPPDLLPGHATSPSTRHASSFSVA
eukprot:scaffold25336_cov62-Phaeocystis_antarctica.AAC.1